MTKEHIVDRLFKKLSQGSITTYIEDNNLLSCRIKLYTKGDNTIAKISTLDKEYQFSSKREAIDYALNFFIEEQRPNLGIGQGAPSSESDVYNLLRIKRED